MSLLRDIQSAAIDSNTDLATLLRKCKVLAARLGNQEFKMWVDNELSGYKSYNDLPEYRVSNVFSKGHFAGPFNSGINNADIPLFCIPEECREMMSKSHMSEPIASIESLVSKNKSGSVQEPWNPDFVARVGRDIYTGMNCMQAWKVIPIGAIIALLSEVRNRILSFVLEIEAEDPKAGEAELNSTPVPQEKVEQIFHMTINGNVQNVATGSHDFKQHVNNNTDTNVDLFNNLLNALKQIQDQNISERVYKSVELMRETQGTKDFKDNY
jgi:AbiTii